MRPRPRGGAQRSRDHRERGQLHRGIGGARTEPNRHFRQWSQFSARCFFHPAPPSCWMLSRAPIGGAPPFDLKLNSCPRFYQLLSKTALEGASAIYRIRVQPPAAAFGDGSAACGVSRRLLLVQTRSFPIPSGFPQKDLLLEDIGLEMGRWSSLPP